jgi:molybdopterin-synthase adenylyltransferase
MDGPPASGAAGRRVSFSAVMTASLREQLAAHLLRADSQEDVCLATYALSTGATRTSAVLGSAMLPGPGERAVHGNASFTGAYFVRAAREAAAAGRGVAALHSHPGGEGWQEMSHPDFDTERSYAPLVHEVTGLPLVGMTVAGDEAWSCRRWDPSGTPEHGESVRVVGACFQVTWNDRLRPPPAVTGSQSRTVSAWGEAAQASMARLRVLVVGVGSVGLDVALRLAATGIVQPGAMDFDTVETVNRDRMIGATMADVRLARGKAEAAGRLMRFAATAANPRVGVHDLSVCEPDGLAAALDYDVIISCVDRPWARGVLNGIAYADLVPVLDGGIGIDTFDDGTIRNAVWRSHLVAPGQPCLVCNHQLNPAHIQADKLGLFDDPEYIVGAADIAQPKRQNVAALAASVSASLLAQFTSLTVAPAGMGSPGPLRYVLSTHTLEHLDVSSKPGCYFEARTAAGDERLPLTGIHGAARSAREQRRARQAVPVVRLRRQVARVSDWLASML